MNQKSALGMSAMASVPSMFDALPLRTFDMVAEYEAAFRSLQAGLNTGKVVLRIGTVRERLGEEGQRLTRWCQWARWDY